jgi:hypothetical protein
LTPRKTFFNSLLEDTLPSIVGLSGGLPRVLPVP